MNDEVKKKNKIDIESFIFLFFITVAFIIRMSNPTICPSQEFFVTTLFAIGCGGLYHKYCANLNLEVVSRYKAGGAISVVLLILVFMPANEMANSSECSGNKLVQNIGDAVFEIFCCKSAFAQDTATSVNKIKNMKIIYPIGKSDQKKLAFSIKNKIENKHPNIKATVYSMGTWRNSIINQFVDSKNDIKIITKTKLEKNLVNNIKKSVPLNNVTIDLNRKLQLLDSDEVMLQIGEF